MVGVQSRGNFGLDYSTNFVCYNPQCNEGFHESVVMSESEKMLHYRGCNTRDERDKYQSTNHSHESVLCATE